jgi:SAM-dependent methyltransferase
VADYEKIGEGYAAVRRPDPRIAAQIRAGLGDARSVVNVGAGAGSYEPADLEVVAVEPSSKMIEQRPAGAARVVQADAAALPFANDSFDVAMAILTLHHWPDWRPGVEEMKRVARKRIVIFTWDPAAGAGIWVHEYLPQVAKRDAGRFCSVHELRQVLGPCEVTPVPIPHDCPDGFLGAFWRRPHAYLDPKLRAGISAFRIGLDLEDGLARLAQDLEAGRWQERWGHLLGYDSLDLGYRLVVAQVG